MEKKRNRPINQRVKTRQDRIKNMYAELKAQELRAAVIIERIADRFCVSDKTVYRDLRLTKSK